MGVLSRSEEVAALVRLKVAAGRIRRQIPPQEHWAFSYGMLQRVSRSFALVIQQLGPDLRNAMISKPVEDLSELPKWNYDGSSTGQAPGEDSEVIL